MSEEGESCESDQGWAVLPDVLLEEAFSYLSLRYLGRCSQVCV
uniref:F-box domain-containing protein n=1 Tax=Plectus sambesii TaxID=2011161 RepID=A0A914V835_9BILA